jgi:hypothetical protein
MTAEACPEGCLVCVPEVQPFESPASWIARLAFSQLVDPQEIMNFLAIRRLKDPDLDFGQQVASNAVRACGIELRSFRFMRHMIASLRKVGADPGLFLLSVDGFAQYRFCKECLRQQREKYYPLHWRFKAWRWCPEHDCLLEERCPHCDSLVLMPASLFRAAVGRKARGWLDQCMVCNATLWAKSRPRRFDALKKFLTPWERFLLNNGRAVLAALWRRSVILNKDALSKRRGLRELARLERAGLLPSGPMRFEQDTPVSKRYRHPLTHAVVDATRVVRPERTWKGLFDG